MNDLIFKKLGGKPEIPEFIIEDDNDVTPVVAAGIVLQAEGDDTSGGIEEFQVLAYQMGIAETEGRVVLPQGDEVAVVLKDLRVALFVLPVELVDAVGRLEGVMHQLLVTQQFFAAEHEGDTL